MYLKEEDTEEDADILFFSSGARENKYFIDLKKWKILIFTESKMIAKINNLLTMFMS